MDKIKQIAENFKSLFCKENGEKPKRNPMIIILLVLVVAGAVGLIVYNAMFKLPTPDELIKEFYAKNQASCYTVETTIKSDKDDLTINMNAVRDSDTCYMDITDNNNAVSMYVDTLDRKYDIYTCFDGTDDWVSQTVKKYTSVDDAQTSFVETNGASSSIPFTVADFKEVAVYKSESGGYVLAGTIGYDRVSSVLGLSVYGLITSSNYESFENYFNLYASKVDTHIEIEFTKSKDLVSVKIMSNEGLATTANEYCSDMNLKDLIYIVTYVDYESRDIYVPIGISASATQKTEE